MRSRGYHWPGNVRELRSVIERAALYATGERVSPSALPTSILEQPSTLWAGRDRRPTLKDVEQTYIRYVLDAVGGSQTRGRRDPRHQPQGALGKAPALRHRLKELMASAGAPRAKGRTSMEQKKAKGFREQAAAEEAADPRGLQQEQGLRQGGGRGRGPGRRGQGLELLHQGVPVQPLQLGARRPADGGRGARPHRRPALRGLRVLRGRDEPEATGSRALGAPLPRLPGEAGSGPPLDPASLGRRLRQPRRRAGLRTQARGSRARPHLPGGVPGLRAPGRPSHPGTALRRLLGRPAAAPRTDLRLRPAPSGAPRVVRALPARALPLRRRARASVPTRAACACSSTSSSTAAAGGWPRAWRRPSSRSPPPAR